ncbi:MAG: hypothetical protein ABIA67_01255, partial [Candidatus Margulisiibacteriota bacterium]
MADLWDELFNVKIEGEIKPPPISTPTDQDALWDELFSTKVETVPQGAAIPGEKAPPRTALGAISDVGVTVGKSIVSTGTSLVGLADIPTFGLVG